MKKLKYIKTFEGLFDLFAKKSPEEKIKDEAEKVVKKIENELKKGSTLDKVKYSYDDVVIEQSESGFPIVVKRKIPAATYGYQKEHDREIIISKHDGMPGDIFTDKLFQKYDVSVKFRNKIGDQEKKYQGIALSDIIDFMKVFFVTDDSFLTDLCKKDLFYKSRDFKSS